MAMIDMVQIHNTNKEKIINETGMSFIRDKEQEKKVFVSKQYKEDGEVVEKESVEFSKQDLEAEQARLQALVDEIKAFIAENYPS